MSDWGDVKLGDVKSQDAIEALRRKMAVPTERFDSLLELSRKQAFTVAGATKMDLLNDLHQAVVNAKANGQSIGQFRNEFGKIVQEHGWQYKGSKAFRTRVIYDTNMRTASMDARWKQMQEHAHRRPYGIYKCLDHNPKTRNPQHQQYHDRVMLLSNPQWDVIRPIKKYGCKCKVISGDDSTLERMGLSVTTDPPPIKYTQRTNSRTGEDYGKWPEGVDVGFPLDNNWTGPDIAFGEKLMQVPKPVREAVLNNDGLHRAAVTDSFKVWAQEAMSADQGRGLVHTVGWLDNAVITALENKDATISTAAITLTDHRLRRMVRDLKKVAGINLPDDVLANLPAYLHDYQAVLIDEKGALLFVLKEPSGSSASKVVINFNFKERGDTTNSVRSAGVVPARSLLNKGVYEIIAGSLKNKP